MFHHSLVQWVLNRLFIGEPSHVETVVLLSRKQGQGTGKGLKSGHLRVSVVSGNVDKFPQSERAKSRKSAAVTLVSLSKAKIGD